MPKVRTIAEISIVICCHNSANRIKACLSKVDSALAQYPDSKAQVIVVDNASTDETSLECTIAFRDLKHARYELVHEPRKGLMHARLCGVRETTGDIICFVDDDNWLTSAYFQVVRRAFDMPSIGYFGCATALPFGRKFPPDIEPFARAFAVGQLYARSGPLEGHQCVWGAGLAVRGDLLRRILDRGFMPVLTGRCGSVQLAGDDSEICHAIRLAGYGGWYEAEVLVEHDIASARMTRPKVLSMYEGFGASAPFLTGYARAGFLPLVMATFALRTLVQIGLIAASRLFVRSLRTEVNSVSRLASIRSLCFEASRWKYVRKNLRVCSQIRAGTVS